MPTSLGISHAFENTWKIKAQKDQDFTFASTASSLKLASHSKNRDEVTFVSALRFSFYIIFSRLLRDAQT